jgi:hypothetical protein
MPKIDIIRPERLPLTCISRRGALNAARPLFLDGNA